MTNIEKESINMLSAFQAGVGTVGTSAAQLDNVANRKCAKKVVVKNTHATNTLYVGLSGVSTTLNGFELSTDEEIELPVENPSLVYVIGSAVGTTYTWYCV